MRVQAHFLIIFGLLGGATCLGEVVRSESIPKYWEKRIADYQEELNTSQRVLSAACEKKRLNSQKGEETKKENSSTPAVARQPNLGKSGACRKVAQQISGRIARYLAQIEKDIAGVSQVLMEPDRLVQKSIQQHLSKIQTRYQTELERLEGLRARSEPDQVAIFKQRNEVRKAREKLMDARKKVNSPKRQEKLRQAKIEQAVGVVRGMTETSDSMEQLYQKARIFEAKHSTSLNPVEPGIATPADRVGPGGVTTPGGATGASAESTSAAPQATSSDARGGDVTDAGIPGAESAPAGSRF